MSRTVCTKGLPWRPYLLPDSPPAGSAGHDHSCRSCSVWKSFPPHTGPYLHPKSRQRPCRPAYISWGPSVPAAVSKRWLEAWGQPVMFNDYQPQESSLSSHEPRSGELVTGEQWLSPYRCSSKLLGIWPPEIHMLTGCPLHQNQREPGHRLGLMTCDEQSISGLGTFPHSSLIPHPAKCFRQIHCTVPALLWI